MGKRTDTKQILQIGKKNNKYIWDSKYFEKQSNESQSYLFQSLEIKKFLKIFLKMSGLSLYKYNINFSELSSIIYISYFKTSEIKNIISKINTSNKLKIVKKKKLVKKYLYKNFILKKKKKKTFKINKNVKNKILTIFNIFYLTYLKYIYYLKKKTIIFQSFSYQYLVKKLIEKNNFITKLNYFLSKKKNYSYSTFNKVNLILRKKIKLFYTKYLIKKTIFNLLQSIKLKKLFALQYQNLLFNLLVKYNNYRHMFNVFLLNKKLYKKRLKSLRYYKNYLKLSENKNIQNLRINNFLKRCSESLNIFTKKKYNTVLVLQQINQNIIYNLTYRQLQSLKKLVTQLRQFKNSNFFKKGINIILSTLINLNSIELLVNYISTQLQTEKRQGFFFKFLVKTFSLLIKHNFSKVKSVKILIKGRINGKPRAKKKLISINKYMSLMTINSSIHSTQSTAYTPNGTFGVKLWINSR